MRLLIFYMILKEVSFLEQKMCPEENSTLYDIKWPSTSNITLSEPICVNQAKESVYRECVDGQWNNEPDCVSIQMEELPKCPKNFTYFDNFCYMFTTKMEFPPECPFGPTIIPFQSYKQVIKPVDEPIWMPVTRDDLGLFYWAEYTSLYKTTFNQSYFYEGNLRGKNCLLYQNDSYIVATSCEEQHVAVCAYQPLRKMSSTLCGTESLCFESDISTKDKCFCVGTSQDDLAEFVEPYQNNIYSSLSNDTCAFGLDKTSNGSYIWGHSQTEIAYTYWSRNAIFDDTHLYGAMTSKGWILSEEIPSCSIFQKEIGRFCPSLELRSNSDAFRLTVTNIASLEAFDSNIFAYCFTDAESYSLVYRLDPYRVVTNDTQLLYFYFIEERPGTYWCEAVGYGDFHVFRTSTSLSGMKPFGAGFVSILRVKYPEGINPLSQDMIDFLKNHVFLFFDKNDYIQDNYAYSIMKIEALDEDNMEMLVNVHFNAIYLNIPSTYDEYYGVYENIQSVTSNAIDFQLIEFLSLDICVEEVVANLTWPTSESGEKVFPREYCFKEDRTRLKRECEENILNGARWSKINETCEIAEQSENLNEILVAFNASDVSVYTYMLFNISKNYKKFNALDVYCIANIYSVTPTTDIALNVTYQTFDNLMLIDRQILAEAEFKMDATSIIVRFIDNILYKEMSYFGTNLVYVSQSAPNLTGLFIKRIDNELTTTEISTYYTLEQLKAIEDIESAILLISPPDNSSHQITFKVYFSNNFFIDGTLVSECSRIFRASVTDIDIYVNGSVWVLYRFNIGFSFVAYCACWKNDQSEWEIKNQAEIQEDFLVCQFPYSVNVAILVTPANVTDILTQLLQSDMYPQQTMKILRDVSNRFKEFASIDVFLVGQILKKLNDAVHISLIDLAETVNNLHKIDKFVLTKSQTEMFATDTVLYYIDTIIRNYKYQTQVSIVTDNFIILIYDVKDSNFTGIALLNDNNKIKIEVLTEDTNSSHLFTCDNFEAALMLSPELKEQLDENYIITTILYIDDALFNEKKSKGKVIGKIFDINLQVANFSGPLSFYYKAEVTQQEQCAYWFYNIQQNLTGTWKNDGKNTNISSSVVQCQFWHTTHFGLLLLDEDKYFEEDYILEWITNVGCFISGVGVFGVLVTAVFFKNWRRDSGNQILLHFIFSVVLQIVLTYVSTSVGQHFQDHFVCSFTGMLLHFSILSQFCWMLVIAVLQYRRFVIVFAKKPRSVLLKACFFAWGFPLVPVLAVYFFASNRYDRGIAGLCYPSGNGLYFGIWLPIAIILMCNGSLYVCIIISITKTSQVHVENSTSDIICQYRLAILLFFLLGLNWVFGFLAELGFGIFFVYLFCALATLQGFILFVFFVVLNTKTRYLYLQALKMYRFKKDF